MKFSYPSAPTAPVIEDLHGVPIPDPYRPLEDPHAPETRAWIEAQNRLTFGYLEQIPLREALRKRLEELWNYPRVVSFFKRGGRYFSLRNDGLQNQNVLYVQESLEAAPRVLLDPNTLSEDGTVALTNYSVSRDGRYLAYALSQSGSDWLVWKVREVESGQDLPDEIQWSKFSTAAWLPDSSGFFYSRYDPPAEGADYTGANYFQKVYLHKLGTPQHEDVLVYGRPDQKEWGFHAFVTHDGRYECLHVWRGTHRENLFFYRAYGSGEPFVELVGEFVASFDFIRNQGSRFYFKTNLEAPRGRVIVVDVARGGLEGHETLVPEGEDVLEFAEAAGDVLVLGYLHHASHRLEMVDLEGQSRGPLPLPTLGMVPTLAGEEDDPELFYGFTSFLYPVTLYHHHLATGQTQTLFAPPLNFDPSRYETHQVFVTSQDGTQVPLFLVHKKGLELRGENPTLLYGYGGFNISMTPAFNPGRLVWLEQGGVFAQACLRGGGEYGEEWYRAGTLERKQNVFDDFIACAEWLIEQGYTQPKRLAIQGGSNGGLLVGAVMTQRPELFGVALPAVGVLDMLRFHKFTIGWAWVSDYGSPDDPSQFRYLLAYSPLHNLKPGTHYPATLITTADHDDRVVPAHSFKFAAALQAAQGGEAPVLIRIQIKAGHGLGKPTRMLIEEQADLYAFTLHQMGLA
ncbi:prolyl oligopeptidase family serine peptidase [Meiothermus sp. CFH 77666]|uniref:prolyl oligopeptidase family serine peptidase n=1 Tax=Meiothermus sp. CFH 77666 TaxID=2817942 RepID=UPI001AA0A523|nr:prolyl oligopeptidase family serine peptidase [Meiothermus sp. CFH 77666]MBO1436189.1 S9 family peptidase [Meiothermus sp. CFH 77666]